jgi:hypothetical protein
MNFFPPANEEDRDSLLGVYRNSINDTEQTEKDLKRWRLFAFGSGFCWSLQQRRLRRQKSFIRNKR